MANTQSGLNPSNMRTLFTSTVLPVLDYGVEIWWKGQKGLAIKLASVQNLGLKSILGAFRTSPTAAMEAEAALPPTTIRLNHICRRYAIRVATLPANHPLRIRCPDTFPLCYDSTPRMEDCENTTP